MKYLNSKKLTVVFFSLSLIFLIGQIVYGVYNNYILNNKQNVIISKVDTYSFFNFLTLEKENLDNIKNYENILPGINKDENPKLESKIIEILRKINAQSKNRLGI